MTTPAATRSRGPILAIAGLIAVVLVVAAGGLWYLFFRPAGPAPVSLATLPPSAAGSSAVRSSVAPGGAAGIAGTWTVDPTMGSVDDGTGTFVGYRIQEQLATVGAAEAVGRTSGVTGGLTIDGTTVTAADFTADLTSLRSDESNRDRQLSRQALETSQFPTATFKLTQPIELGAVPADGHVIDATATGDLTLHGVTKSVQIPLQARLDGDVITVGGSLPITFSDWSIEKPQAMIVLSVDDHGTMEVQLHLTRS
jgi:polyisoprenoid-binding protein YceI